MGQWSSYSLYGKVAHKTVGGRSCHHPRPSQSSEGEGWCSVRASHRGPEAERRAQSRHGGVPCACHVQPWVPAGTSLDKCLYTSARECCSDSLMKLR